MQAPAKNSSLIYNCHKSFRIVLLAGGNCDYEFTLINIGEAARRSHRGVFSNSNLSYAIVNDLLDCLEPENVNKSDFTLPLVFVGDNTFPMKTNLIKTDSAFHLISNFALSYFGYGGNCGICYKVLCCTA